MIVARFIAAWVLLAFAARALGDVIHANQGGPAVYLLGFLALGAMQTFAMFGLPKGN